MGEHRNCERGREEALPEELPEETAQALALSFSGHACSRPPSVMPALDPSGDAPSRPSDTSSAPLSLNCCAVPSGHTSAHPPRPRQLSPPLVITVLAPYSNPFDLPLVLRALAPPAMPALALSRGCCAFPTGNGSGRHACGRLLRSRLRLRVVARRSPPAACHRPLQ